MTTRLITPLSDEFNPLLQAFCDMGYRPILQTTGNLSVHEIKELDLLPVQDGHGKTQFAVQTQHLLDLIPSISLVICPGVATSSDVDDRVDQWS